MGTVGPPKGTGIDNDQRHVDKDPEVALAVGEASALAELLALSGGKNDDTLIEEAGSGMKVTAGPWLQSMR